MYDLIYLQKISKKKFILKNFKYCAEIILSDDLKIGNYMIT